MKNCSPDAVASWTLEYSIVKSRKQHFKDEHNIQNKQ